MVVERERVSPEDLPDSGCTGLLDEEDEDSCSLQRAGSSSTAGDQSHGGPGGAGSSSHGHPGLSGAGVSSSDRAGGDRDSGGGSVASSCGTGGGYQRSNSVVDAKEVIYASIQKRKSVNGTELLVPVYQQLRQPLLHVDGPLDGSPYAVVNPLVKHKGFGDSGISVSYQKYFSLIYFRITVLAMMHCVAISFANLKNLFAYLRK